MHALPNTRKDGSVSDRELDSHTNPAGDLSERRRLSFGSVAEQYDRFRPAYPEALVDDALAYAGVSSRPAGTGMARAVEVGAGTGIATRQFAARGLQITAVEPDPLMAELNRSRLDGLAANVEVVISDLEHAELDPGSFQLLYSATAWHWVSREVRYQLANRALVRGGGLAVFWNWPAWERVTIRQELDAAYRRAGAEQLIKQGSVMAPGTPMPREERNPDIWQTEIDGIPGFEDAQTRWYEWERTYSSADYVGLLGTHSDHNLQEAELKQRLFAEVAAAVDAAGGSFELPFRTLLCLARAC